MTKQVQKTTDEAQAPVAHSTNDQQRNLYVKVITFNAEGKTIGERIVDMYHYGTRNWLQNHLWWAMHNGHEVEVNTANDEDVQAYVAQATKELAAKFQPEAAPLEAVAA